MKKRVVSESAEQQGSSANKRAKINPASNKKKKNQKTRRQERQQQQQQQQQQKQKEQKEQKDQQNTAAHKAADTTKHQGEAKAKSAASTTKNAAPKSNSRKDNKKDNRPSKENRASMKQQRESLPIFPARSKLLAEIRKHDTLVIIGETGSGKTTQIPQYLYESGFCRQGMLAVTQPRRVAAVTVAQRVADEVGVKLGSQVGYSIRFDDKTSEWTKIKYMTDGMLLRETALDPLLGHYSVVVLDEAHERTLHTDMLFAILKGIQVKRRALQARGPQGQRANTVTLKLKGGRDGPTKALGPLKILCMSATLEAKAFSTYFNEAKILYISGRLFPVQVYYAEEPQSDYVDAVVITVLQIHLEQECGDILVFLTGQDEIDMCRRLLETKVPLLPKKADTMLVLPLYAALPNADQLKVFDPCPPGCRKIILATNIAETSITMTGIRYVVDTGVVKIRQYHAKTGMDSLVVVPISRAEAFQRSGRAGRVAAGVCYRLYTEPEFTGLRQTIVPEILRCNLASVVLQLKALRVQNILDFDFMDRPPQAAMVRAMEHLYALGALRDDGNLSTPLGTRMAVLPLDPLFSRVLLASCEPAFACSAEVLSIVSILSLEAGVFMTPANNKEKAGAAKARFVNVDGDHLTYLEAYTGFMGAKNQKQWCFENFINFRAMQKMQKIRSQLSNLLVGLGLDPMLSVGLKVEAVRRCLVTGFFLNTARLQPDGTYRSLMEGQTVHVHPSSVLMGMRKHPCVLYNQLVLTARHYMRDITVIQQAWLPELVPAFFSSAHSTQADKKLHLSSRAHKQLSTQSV